MGAWLTLGNFVPVGASGTLINDHPKNFIKICHLFAHSNVFIVKRSFANTFMTTKGVHK